MARVPDKDASYWNMDPAHVCQTKEEAEQALEQIETLCFCWCVRVLTRGLLIPIRFCYSAGLDDWKTGFVHGRCC